MPYQLAVPGPDQYSDTCESAVVYELELHPGDVIIAATDGVLDNLWDHQIAMLVHQFLGVRCSCCWPRLILSIMQKYCCLHYSAYTHPLGNHRQYILCRA